MRAIELNSKVPHLSEMNQAYGRFDLDVNTGVPTPVWERRNLQHLRLDYPLKNAFFPEFWHRRVTVNRRAAGALGNVLRELAVRYTPEAMNAHGLDQFVRCYCFGGGDPSLFWFGGGWELSPQVVGEVLAETIKVFVKHGWTYCGVSDKKRLREFEFW